MTYQTPGVYTNELNAFPNSVVGVATIPAFIGYTEKTDYQGKSLKMQPVQIISMAEFEMYFGGAPVTTFSIIPAETNEDTDFVINNKALALQTTPGTMYYLYNSMRLFFQNGGGTCYIVSVGDYSSPVKSDDILAGLEQLKNIPDSTLYCFPDAALLPAITDFAAVANTAVNQSGQLGSCFTILDVYEGYQPLETNVIQNFRAAINAGNLGYGAAYYPFLNTTITSASEITYKQFLNLFDYLADETGKPAALPSGSLTGQQISQYLSVAFKSYNSIVSEALQKINLLPPSGAMAGIYTLIDNTEGVWVAPANISPVSVVSPAVKLDDNSQAGLNVDAIGGKSINALRFFNGQGTLVWGARTMDGNSQDWRYVNVRRSIIYIEQSVIAALQAYTFAPNVSNTWATVKSMVENFLTGCWKQGMLQGARPTDAFSVSVGLGSTMTGEDILNGYMNVTVMVAITHPAEFIVLTFQQQMQTS